jgi:hypothetical protein
MAFDITTQKPSVIYPESFIYFGMLSAVLHNVTVPSVLVPQKGVKNGLARKGIKSLVISF